MGNMIERMVPLFVDAEQVHTFLCTPDALDELAIGYLITQGHVSAIEEIVSVAADADAIHVRTKNGIQPLQPMEKRVEALPKSDSARCIELGEVRAIMDALMQEETFYGTHCIGLKTPAKLLFREDIGRHNALDKIIGRGLMDNVDFAQCVMAATGRISLEMLHKAACAHIPIIVSKKYPSDLSSEIAQHLGICIVGRALLDAPHVYSCTKRVGNFS